MVQDLIYDFGVPYPFYTLFREGEKWVLDTYAYSLDFASRRAELLRSEGHESVVVNRVWLLAALRGFARTPIVVIREDGSADWYRPALPEFRRAAIIFAATLYSARTFAPLPRVRDNGLTLEVASAELATELIPETLDKSSLGIKVEARNG